MPVHVAFLRAINVGGRTVPMARLRQHFEELGLTQVETFIASGNVRFAGAATSRSLERTLESHLESRLGITVGTFLRSPAEVAAIPARLPRAAREPGVTTYIGFLRTPLARASLTALAALESPVDSLVADGRELFWCCRKTIGQSPITGNRLENALGQPLTLRNLTTVQRVITTWCQPT